MNDIARNADISNTAIIINSTIGELCMIGNDTRFCYSSLGDYSYVGDNSHIFSSSIGKYSSLSWNVTIGPGVHQYQRITSHAMLYASRFRMLSQVDRFYDQYAEECIIGNDVWIGCNATIFRNVRIGDDCIIGANAIITRDIPPYSVIVGVNQHLKYRFSMDIIERLLKIQWWNYSNERIKSCIEMIAQEPTNALLDMLEEKLMTTNSF